MSNRHDSIAPVPTCILPGLWGMNMGTIEQAADSPADNANMHAPHAELALSLESARLAARALSMMRNNIDGEVDGRSLYVTSALVETWRRLGNEPAATTVIVAELRRFALLRASNTCAEQVTLLDRIAECGPLSEDERGPVVTRARQWQHREHSVGAWAACFGYLIELVCFTYPRRQDEEENAAGSRHEQALACCGHGLSGVLDEAVLEELVAHLSSSVCAAAAAE